MTIDVGIRLKPEGGAASQAELDKVSAATGRLEVAATKAAAAAESLGAAQRDVTTASRASERDIGQLSAVMGQLSVNIDKLAANSGQLAGSVDQLTAGFGRLDAAQRRIVPGSSGVTNAHHAQAGAARLNANQTAQLSAQLQDLFVQIQAGGSPLTAFIQQGSQLSAVFGGFGPALRAVGSLITPTVAAVGGLGLAAGAVALAYQQGSAETDAYGSAVINTGRAAGVTADRLQELAAQQDDLAGTQAKAAGVLAMLAGSAQVAAAQLAIAADAAVAMDRAGGAAAEDTAKKFIEIGKAPVQALLKLNEAENFLTRAVYDQVRALQEQGRQAEAAAVAQRAYAETVKSRATELEAQLGSLQRAWRWLKDGASEAWDAMLGIGRADTLQQQIAAVQKRLESARTGIYSRDKVPGLEQDLANLQEQVRLINRATEAAAERAEQEKAAIKWSEDGVKYLGKKAQMEREIAMVRAQAKAAGLAADDPELLKRITEIQKKYADSTKSLATEYANLIASSKSATAAMLAQAASGERLTEGEKQLLDLQTKIEQGTLEYVPALYKAAAAQYQLATQQERSQRATLEGIAGTLAAIKAREDEYTGLATATKALEDQVAEQLAANATARTGIDYSARLAATKLREAAAAKVLQAIKVEEKNADFALGEQYRKNAAELLKLADAKEAATAAGANDAARKSIDAFLDPSKAESFGDALRNAFGGAASAMVALNSALGDYGRKQAAIAAERSKLAAIDNPYERYGLEMKLNEKASDQQIEAYANIAGAAKGFFEEGSKGYKTLQAAEGAFRAYQLASDLVKGASAAAVAVANQAQGDPYTAWARMAAMAVAMGTLGFAVAGGFNKGGAPVSAADRQAATGTGTILGDAGAKSESIARSIEAIEETAAIELETQSGMLRSLRNIEASLSGLGSLIVRAGGITTGGSFGIQTGTLSVNKGDPIARALGIDDSWLADVAPLVGTLQSLWGKVKQDITDAGLAIGGTIADLSAGRGVQQYADVTRTESSWFGLKKDTSTSTQYADVGGELAAQFGRIFDNIGDVLQGAAGSLGRDGQAVADAISRFVVDIPRLSLQGLKGDELQEAINNAVSASADSAARAALAGLDDFQQIGEGYFETVVRVSAGVESAGYELEKLGLAAVDFTAIANKQGDIAAEVVRESIMAAETAGGQLSNVGKIISTFDGEAGELAETFGALTDVRDALRAMGVNGEALTVQMVRAAGGLSALESSLAAYSENYLTQQERTAALTAELSAEFGKLGYALPSSREGFRALVKAIDPMAEGGAKALAQLLALGDAFAELVPMTIAEAAAARGASDVAQERMGLETRLLQIQGDAAALRERERDAIAPANLALYDLVTTLERAAAVTAERKTLEHQYLQLVGDSVELRNREREALDASNRGLYDAIKALETLEALTDSLRDAAGDAMAAVTRAIDAEKDRLREQYEAGISALDDREEAARAAHEVLMAQLDAEREAAQAIYKAQAAAIETALDALDAQAKAQATEYAAASKALKAERDAAVTAYKAADTAFEETIKRQTETISRLKGLNDAIGSTLRAMRPIGSEGADRARAQQQIASALAVARASGALPSADDLRDALSIVAKPSEDLFGSFEDYARDFYRTAIDLRDLADVSGAQLAGAQTELQATIEVRDALREAHEANITRLDGLKEALDLANEQAREAIDLQREALQSQLDGARDTLDNRLESIDDRREQAADALDLAIAAIAGERDALTAAFEKQIASLDALLETARAQYEVLLGIDGGIKTIPEALSGLADALAAFAAVSGGAPPAVPAGPGAGSGTVEPKVNQWVTTGGVQTWTDSSGAVAIQPEGNKSTDTLIIKGTGGEIITATEAQKFVNDNLGTDAAGVASAASSVGISSSGVDALMGYAAGTFAAVTGNGKVTGVTGSWTAQEIRDTVTAMMAAGDLVGIYELAKAEKISAATLDAIMGWPAGSANITAASLGLPAFASGGVHAGGVRLVGERGPELEVTGPARIFSFDQTREMLGGQAGGPDLLRELQELRREVAALRAESRSQQQAIAVNTGKTARLQERWDGDGMPEVREVTA